MVHSIDLPSHSSTSDRPPESPGRRSHSRQGKTKRSPSMFAALRRRRKRPRARVRPRTSAGLRRRPCLECLEDRIVPAYSLFRPELLVNPPDRPPGQVEQPPPVAVASDCEGDFVVAWASQRQAGLAIDVFAQRYSQNGTIRGGVITVASGLRANGIVGFITVDVAMNASGAFVVTYTFGGDQGSRVGVNRYAANGTQLGPVIVLSGDGSGKPADIFAPSVALADNGVAYVAYASFVDPAGFGSDVFIQRVGAVPLGGPVHVSTDRTLRISGLSIACTAAGDSVVTWNALVAGTATVVARQVTA